MNSMRSRATPVAAAAALAIACGSAVQPEHAGRVQTSLSTWTEIGPFHNYDGCEQGNKTGRLNAIAYDPVHPGSLYVGAPHGGVWASSDNGQTFTPLSDLWPLLNVSAIAVAPSGSTVYVGTGDIPDDPGGGGPAIGIMKGTNTDGVWTWTNISPPNHTTRSFTSIAASPDAPGHLLAVEFPGDIWRSTDDGNTWAVTTPGSAGFWNVVVYQQIPNGSRAVYLVGEGPGGQIWTSGDDGVSWNQLPSPLSNKIQQRLQIASSPSRSGTLWLSSITDQKVFVSRDSGQTWQDITGAGHDLVGHTNLNIFASDNFVEYSYPFAVSGFGGQDYVFSGAQALFMHLDSGGGDGNKTWTAVDATRYPGRSCVGHDDEHAVAADPFNSPNVMIGNDGGAFYLAITQNPLNFTNTAKNDTLDVGQAWGAAFSLTDPNMVLAAEQDTGLTVSKNDNLNTWVSPGLGDGHSAAIHPLLSGEQYGIGDGALYHTGNAWGDGSSFQQVTMPSTFAAEKKKDDAPLVFDPNHPAWLYIGTTFLYRRNLDTQTWDSLHAGPFCNTASTIAFAPSDPMRIYVGDDSGCVYMTQDAGQTWTGVFLLNQSAPNHAVRTMSVHPLYANRVLIGDDASTVWSGDSTSPFNLVDVSHGALPNASQPGVCSPVCEIHGIVFDPAQPDSEWYAGTPLGVWETSNSGATWAQWPGVPNVPVRALTYSSTAFGSLNTATFGRGLWRADMSSSPPRAPRVPFVGAIVSGDGQCVDVTGANTASGTAVEQWQCHGLENQRWTYDQSQLVMTWTDNNGGLHYLNANPSHMVQSSTLATPFYLTDVNLIGLDGYCLDAWGGATAGATLGTYPCNGQTNQQWQLIQNGWLRATGTNLCVSGDPNTLFGLTLSTCGSSTPTFFLSPGGTLKTTFGWCIDSDPNAHRAWAVPCDGNEEQRWSVQGNIRSYDGTCLDVLGASFAQGTMLDTYPCNGQWNQAWTFYP